MLPPALLPELLNRGSLTRLAHSALPDAPVQPHRDRRSRRVAASARSLVRSLSMVRRPTAPLLDDEPVPAHA